MRIALVIPGGVGRDRRSKAIPAVVALVDALSARHHVLVAATDQEDAPDRYPLGSAVVVCLGRDPLTLHWKWKLLRRCRRLLAVLRDFRPDVLHGIWFFDPGLLAILAGRRLGVPVVLSVGGGEFAWIPEIGFGGSGTWTRRSLRRFLVRSATAVTGGSRGVVSALARIRPDAQYVPLGCVAAPSGDRPARRAGEPWRLLQAATINEVKDPATLLAAVRILLDELGDGTADAAGVRLDWAGEDILGGFAAREVARMGLGEVVQLHGHRDNEEVRRLMAGADLYVQSSLYESQGVSVCEAAMAGVPTVGSAVGIVADLSPHAALAVRPRDPRALARGVAALLRDGERREQMGRAAREWARSHDVQWTAARFESIYEAVRCGEPLPAAAATGMGDVA